MMINKRTGMIVWLAMILVQTAFVYGSDPNDIAGSKDPALFTRMPGYHIYRYEVKKFDRFEFPIAPDFRTEAQEGHHLWIVYDLNEGAKPASGLQITRNYCNAAMSAGGKVLVEFEDGGIQLATLKIVKDQVETWAHIAASGNQYSIHVVEKELMKQDVKVDASQLAGSIRSTGRASVYGIYFDSGKSEVKPESTPALTEIAKMLKSDAALRLYVVGHTDNTGTFDNNIRLSNDRALAVIKELTARYSIEPSRLKAFGAGPTSPLQSNQTEQGKAKNRRVELVAQ